MKSGISILLAGVLCAAATNNNLYCQTVKADLLNRNSLIYIDPESPKNPETPSHKFPVSRRVNPRALRHFLDEYREFDSVRWYQSDKGSAASFILDGVQIVTFYDKHGNRTSKRKVYKENKLPGYVREMIKCDYYDYEIYIVAELEYPDQTIYVVTMQNKTTWVHVKVANFKVELVKKFLKSE